MPSEEMHDISLINGRPFSGKGALGTWRFQDGSRTQSRD